MFFIRIETVDWLCTEELPRYVVGWHEYPVTWLFVHGGGMNTFFPSQPWARTLPTTIHMIHAYIVASTIWYWTFSWMPRIMPLLCIAGWTSWPAWFWTGVVIVSIQSRSYILHFRGPFFSFLFLSWACLIHWERNGTQLQAVPFADVIPLKSLQFGLNSL